ncbi:hypothetical protein [Mesorhizobium sp. M0643]|uniref:hypothetical protein n=1 Tax=Mesorhizobium sp. M0643 TaxID=2956978 RepID=UPI00333ACC4B
MAEDVGQEDRFLDRRQRMLRHIARRITATAIEAELADDAELVDSRNGLAIGDARAPSCYRVVEQHRIAPALPDKVHDPIDDKLGTPV